MHFSPQKESAAARRQGLAFLLALAFAAGCREAPRTLPDAARRGNEAQVVALITPGSVDAVDPAGQTPLRIAAGAGNVEAVRGLLAHGAKVDLADARGRTALHLAAEEGRDKVIPILLHAGASWKVEDADGRTPLLLAVANKHSFAAGVLRDAALLPVTKAARKSSGRFGAKAQIPFASMHWTADPGGGRFFRIWGDPDKSAWGGLLSLDPGSRTVMLSPRGQLAAVVIAGKPGLPGIAEPLSAGFGLTVDSAGRYSFSCLAGEACLVYEEEDAPRDRTALAGDAVQGVHLLPLPAPDAHEFVMGWIWSSDDERSFGRVDSIPHRGASGVHQHEFEQLSVTISGLLRFAVDGEGFVDLPPGSVSVIPAGVQHNIQCVNGKPCVRFYEQD